LPVILSYLREKSTDNPKKSDIFVEVWTNMEIKRYIYVFTIFLKINRYSFRHLLPPIKILFIGTMIIFIYFNNYIDYLK